MRGTDLSGKRFGMLTVVSKSDSEKRRGGGTYARWLCVCDCGNQKVALANSLRNGDAKSCGCIGMSNLIAGAKKRALSRRASISYVGVTFGLLTVVSEHWETYRGGSRRICVCSCLGCEGTKSIVAWSLLSGRTTSCGCAIPGQLSSRTTKYSASTAGVSRQQVAQRIHAGWDLHRALTTPVRKCHDDTTGDLELRSAK